MNLSEIKFKKIQKSEFNKLKKLFPDNNEKWIKYRNQRLKQFDKNDIDIFVIEYNNTYIGEISVNYSSHNLILETIPNKRVYFEAFRLDKKYQGYGLGQQLIGFALDDLEKRGYTEFTIGVEDNNEIAKHIYFKLGFTNPIDKGHGNEFDPCLYTLYMKSI